MNAIEEHLFFLEKYYDKGSELIEWNDLSNFERSYRYNFKLTEVQSRLKYLHEWRCNIGKEVYISRDKWNYTLVDGYSSLDIHNQRAFDDSKSIVFTEEVFNTLCVDYLNYSVGYLTADILERGITSNSTCKMSNLAFEWKLDCKTELIKDFKNILKR